MNHRDRRALEMVGSVSSWESPDSVLVEFLESLRDGVFVVGADRRVKYRNAQFLLQFDLAADAVMPGDRLYDVLHFLAVRGKLGPGSDRSPEGKAADLLARWGTDSARQERRRLPDGSVLDIYRTETTRGETIAVSVDATEAELTARQVERQRVYMESLLENTSDGITLLDRDGCFAMFNRQLLRLYDVDPSRVYWGIDYDSMVKQFGDLEGISPADREEAMMQRREFAFDPTMTQVRRPLFNGRTLSINKTNLPGGGCVMTARDITDEITREEALLNARQTAEASNRHKSEFVARMSHEMRTPLNGILGVTALLDRTDLQGQQKELINVIKSSGKVLLRLIDDILDLSRLDAETFDVVEERMVVSNLIDECLGIIRPAADDAGLDLRFVGNTKDIPALRGDHVRIKQILLNLLTNAVKFTETGYVELALASENGPEGVTLTIAVSDSGVGIAGDKLGQIFDRFYQIDGTVTRLHGGAGLGLSITQKLVDRMGGTIQVSSEPGKGTVFRVKLTLQPAGRARIAKT